MTSEIRRRRPRAWTARLAVVAVAAVAVVGFPAAASAATTRSTQPVVVASARADHAREEGPAHASPATRPVGTGDDVHLVAASAPTARASRVAGGGLVARLGEARRSDGPLGQWVVGILLAIVVALWVALVAVVVRAHMGFARSAGRGRGTTVRTT